MPKIPGDDRTRNFNPKEEPANGKPVSNREGEEDGDPQGDTASPPGEEYAGGSRGVHSGVNLEQETLGAGTPGAPATQKPTAV